MLYNLFNFQSNDNWDTDGLYWYNELYTKKLVWTSLNQFHGLQKTGPRWSSLVPTISRLVLDQLQFTVACLGGKKPDWTGLANTRCNQGVNWIATEKIYLSCRQNVDVMHILRKFIIWASLKCGNILITYKIFFEFAPVAHERDIMVTFKM